MGQQISGQLIFADYSLIEKKNAPKLAFLFLVKRRLNSGGIDFHTFWLGFLPVLFRGSVKDLFSDNKMSKNLIVK